MREAIYEFISGFICNNITWSVNRRREFYNMAAGFIADGKPVFDTLQVFEDRWRAVKDSRAETISRMMADMRGRNGRALRFGEALSRWVPTMEAMAVDAGEQAGDIAEGLRMASRLADTQSRIKRTIAGEMVYPGFLLLLLIVFLLVLKHFVIPVFEEIAPRQLWPTSAHYLGIISDNAGLLSLLLIGFLASIMLVFRISRGTWTGDVRNFFDRFVPPWNINRRISGAILMSCFASFLRAGVPFSSILDKLGSTASDWEKYHLNLMRAKMRRGMRDGDAMAGELFDQDVRWEIGVYGGMTSFDKALESLSVRVTERVIGKIQKFAAVLRTSVMVMVAGMIVWIYGSFFSITMLAKRSSGV